VSGQLARGVRLLADQVFHLVEEVFQLAGTGIPAVVRVAVGGFGGQPDEDVIELGAQLGGRVGPARTQVSTAATASSGGEQVADPVLPQRQQQRRQPRAGVLPDQ
jgi:hypothetical protein